MIRRRASGPLASHAMKPDASSHDDTKEYCSDLVLSTGLTRAVLCKQLGIDERTLRRYMSGERRFPYLVQFALECVVLDP